MSTKGEYNMYLGHFSSKEEVAQAFAIDLKSLKGCKILLAWYGFGDYDGSAFVLYTRGGKLYEVTGGHCSCYGLEGQWDPEETSADALKHRIDNGNLGRDSYYDEGVFDKQLIGVLNRYVKASAKAKT
jgi:hypothetical protein